MTFPKIRWWFLRVSRVQEKARSLLLELGEDGIDWYCGKRENYIDAQGNNYGAVELNELKKILGNDKQLDEEFCR